MAEARTGRRFPLALPITIRARKSERGAKGITTNVSAAGVFLQSATNLEVGSTIEFDIALPANITGTKVPVEIHCKGRVVRTERNGGHAGKGRNAAPRRKESGIACVIDNYKFVRKKGQ